jgi:hypothetical protein
MRYKIEDKEQLEGVGNGPLFLRLFAFLCIISIGIVALERRSE